MRQVSVLERDGKSFYYVNFGSERHDRPSFRLWISSKLVRDGKVQIPLEGARIHRTEKGNYVLKPDSNYRVFLIGWKAGYRGWSEYEILGQPEDAIILPFKVYHSPRGNLGISEYALVSTKSPRIRVRLTRGGRLYGKPSEKTVEYSFKDGKQVETEFVDDPELAEL